MNLEQLQKLAEAPNVEALRRAIQTLCEPFGSPLNIRVLPDKQREVYVCFLEMAPPKLNSSVIENFDGFYFANGVAFKIPFKHATN